jgi:hypothetical protein
MRTTLILNDDLVEMAKKKAAERQTSLSALVNEALRASFKESPTTQELVPFHVLTYSPKDMNKVDTSPQAFYDLMVAEDSESYGS